MRQQITVVAAAVVFMLLAAVAAHADVFNMPDGQTSLTFVPVGNPGNANNPSSNFGSVGYAYQMGKYDVTVGQYVQFLNAVAATDTYGLYNPGMALGSSFQPIGSQSGSSGSYSYWVTGSYNKAANCPIFHETWGDASPSPTGCKTASRPGPKGREQPKPGRIRLMVRFLFLP